MTIGIGSRLAHYEIVAHLGAGGMGEVYKARDPRLNRMVAIKVLHADRVADPTRKQRFIQEAQAASALNHPNIVVIHDISSQDGVDFMVMECVEGKTLDALMPRQGMRLSDALKAATQLTDALSKAHAAGIIHRDLKPSNVMVSESGHVKLLDFGLAKLTDETPLSEDDATRTKRLETEEGSIMGTTSYMSPEQAEGRKLDLRSDIFSFGSVFYEMVTGNRPFDGGTRMSILSAIIKEEPKALAGVPADLEKIIRRCLRKDPARRFQHMEDLKVALEEVREDSESGRLPAAPAETKRKGVPKWIWAAALAALAVAGLTAWSALNSRPKPEPVEALRKSPLTSYPGSETSPTFSPDGRQVAFSWNGENRDNFDIYLKMVDGGEPLRLTNDPAPEGPPAWSPDGRFIAFRRGAGIYLISPLGGAQRKVADVAARRIAWTPDGKSIAFTGAQPGVVLLNLDTGERRKLTDPPATSGGDDSFAFSSDGRNLAFVRWTTAQGAAELYVMRLPDGQPKRVGLPANLTRLYGVEWTPNGKDLVVVEDPGGGNVLWRVTVESGQALRIAGLDDGVESPAISAASHRLAYSRVMQDENIWSLSDGKSAPVIASTRRDYNPRLSLDGTKIAFVSDRNGAREIYVSDAQGGRVAQLTSLGDAVADAVQWSPDGREVAFAALKNANRDVYVVPADGGATRRVTTEPSDDARPSYSMDGKWIYFRSNRSGKDQIWKMPRAGGGPIQMTQDGGFEAVESFDGKALYFFPARDTKGLWSMPVSGGPAEPVPGLEAATSGRWAVTETGLCYGEMTRPWNNNAIVCWSSSTRKSSKMGTIEKPAVSFAPPTFAASRDGKRFLWTQSDQRDSDLVLVENFR